MQDWTHNAFVLFSLLALYLLCSLKHLGYFKVIFSLALFVSLDIGGRGKFKTNVNCIFRFHFPPPSSPLWKFKWHPYYDTYIWKVFSCLYILHIESTAAKILSLRCSSSFTGVTYSNIPLWPHKNNPRLMGLGYLGVQVTDLLRPVHLSGNTLFRNAWTLLYVWNMVGGNHAATKWVALLPRETLE